MRFKLLIICISMIMISVFAASASDQIIVQGNPPITMKAAQCHMRLIEFVLGTRLTAAQKDAFLDAIKKECTQMPETDRQNFLSAVELASSMDSMEPSGHEAVKFVLKKDFEDTAASLPDDPAAVLFLKIKSEISTPRIKMKEEAITRQSFAALVEYLQFLGNPDQPVKLSESALASLEKALQNGYSMLSDDEQAVLDEFELTWFMIRAGWQNCPDSKIKDNSRNEMQKLQIDAGTEFELKKIKAFLSPDIYGDLIDTAAKLDFEPSEWTVNQYREVW